MKHGFWSASRVATRARTAAQLALATGVLAAASSGQGLDEGLLWSVSPGAGEQWIPGPVSIGNHGTQVFTHLGSQDTYTKLISAHETGTSVQPIWNRFSGDFTTRQSCDSTPTDDLHVALHQYYSDSTNQPQAALLQVFRSTDDTPVWSYQMPLTIFFHKISGVHVSDDGKKLVAYAHDSLQAQLEVAVFRPESVNPNNPVPTHYTSLPSALQLLGSDLSSDGKLLLLEYASAVRVYDTDTGQVVFTLPVTGGDQLTKGAAISRDGEYFAYATTTGFKVYRRASPTSWVLQYLHSPPEAALCTALDIAKDTPRLVAGYGLLSSPSVRVEAVDLPTHTVRMSKVFYGTGSLDNLVADVAVSPDGEYFVAGFWGDAGGQVPELVTFRTTSPTPLATYPQPGSVVDVDISASGRRIVAGVRSSHANQASTSGTIQCYNVVDRDLALEGTPSVGQWVDFEWQNPNPNQPATFGLLLESRELNAVPETLPGFSGSLYLPRGTITQYAPDSVVGGVARLHYRVPAAGLAVGSDLYFQGFTNAPRRLTTDWIKMTIVP